MVDRSDGHPVVASRSMETGTWPVMSRYRLRVYKSSDQLWQTHDIFAEDDATAKHSAQQKFNELAAELAGQEHPKVDDPTLERFVLYNCDRLVCEIVHRGGR
jgi:hypothetical protein